MQVYLTCQRVTGAAPLRAGSEANPEQQNYGNDAWLLAIVERVLAGQESGDEQSAVSFDRALATGGTHAGVPPTRPSVSHHPCVQTFINVFATGGTHMLIFCAALPSDQEVKF